MNRVMFPSVSLHRFRKFAPEPYRLGGVYAVGADTLGSEIRTNALWWSMKPISYARHRFPPDVICWPKKDLKSALNNYRLTPVGSCS